MRDQAGLMELCRAVYDAIDCERVAIGRIHRVTGRYQAVFWPPLPAAAERELRRVFLRHGLEHPRLRAFLQGQRIKGVVGWQALDADGRFRETGLYRRFYAPLGITDQLSFGLPAGGSTAIGVTVDRAGGTFSDADVERFEGILRRIAASDAQGDRLAAVVMAAFEQVTTTSGEQPNGSDAAAVLTPRQLELAAALIDGLSNKEIARRLGISPGTVRTHLQEIYRRLGVGSRAAAVARLLGGPGVSSD